MRILHLNWRTPTSLADKDPQKLRLGPFEGGFWLRESDKRFLVLYDRSAVTLVQMGDGGEGVLRPGPMRVRIGDARRRVS